MNTARRGPNYTGGASSGPNEKELKNRRLAGIREAYRDHKMTPEQKREESNRLMKEMIERMKISGAVPSAIAMFQRHCDEVDALVSDMPEEEPIVTATFNYNDGRNIKNITISSEASRHWRLATVHDVGSIVYLPEDGEFGEFDDTGYETDEEFPDVQHTTAIVCTFSGQQRSPWAFDGRFQELLMVPEEILQGVNNEAPPGKFFSGKSLTKPGERSKWSPAPVGQTWLQHPFLENPNGKYFSHEQAFYLESMIECPEKRQQLMEDHWRTSGALAYWCPVLKQFLSEGERLRQEHWFHNGDGSAQQRYYYNKMEMLDRHGGLANLPENIDSLDGEICFVGVTDFENILAQRLARAERNGEVIEIDQDSKPPAKKQRK